MTRCSQLWLELASRWRHAGCWVRSRAELKAVSMWKSTIWAFFVFHDDWNIFKTNQEHMCPLSVETLELRRDEAVPTPRSLWSGSPSRRLTRSQSGWKPQSGRFGRNRIQILHESECSRHNLTLSLGFHSVFTIFAFFSHLFCHNPRYSPQYFVLWIWWQGTTVWTKPKLWDKVRLRQLRIPF